MDIDVRECFAQFVWRLKRVKPEDVLSVFSAMAASLAAPFFRLRHKRIWLICERRNEARDNGYWFYKYVRENHPEIEAVYAIDPESPDGGKVKALGPVIPFGSFSHWVHYFAAEKNISSQKEGKPNAAVCFVLEVYLNLRRNRVFLQHGIIKDDLRWLHHDLTKMNLFICGAAPEYAYVKERFGYPAENLCLTGLCRFDNLPLQTEPQRQILVMPTMRRWLAQVSAETDREEGSREFTDSEYYRSWNSFLSDPCLAELLEKYDMQLLFFPHAALQRFADRFSSPCSRVRIGSMGAFDVQELMIRSDLMITDYSSVYFDFAYMGKPVIYYQFDYEKYRRVQYQEGYFSYTEDGFGPVIRTQEALLKTLSEYLDNYLQIPAKYRERIDRFFTYRDSENCKRVFDAICKMKK